MANQRSRRNSTSTEQVVVEAIFKAVWQLLSWPFKGLSGGKAKLGDTARQSIGRHWEEVAWYAEQPQYQVNAIMEADKLLDHTFRAMNVQGNSLGERLKAAESLFPRDIYNNLWEAHKLRNRLAHEVGIGVSEAEVRQAVRSFKAAFVQLGVIEE